MIAGVRGRLIATSFIESELRTLAGDCVPPRDALRSLGEWAVSREGTFGPASSVRSIADGVVVPLLRILGFSIIRRVDRHDFAHLEAGLCGRPLLPVIVVGWAQSLDAAWRESVLHAVRADERWSLIVNGTALRI